SSATPDGPLDPNPARECGVGVQSGGRSRREKARPIHHVNTIGTNEQAVHAKARPALACGVRTGHRPSRPKQGTTISDVSETKTKEASSLALHTIRSEDP